jgi:hypothetical protein
MFIDIMIPRQPLRFLSHASGNMLSPDGVGTRDQVGTGIGSTLGDV